MLNERLFLSFRHMMYSRRGGQHDRLVTGHPEAVGDAWRLAQVPHASVALAASRKR